MTELEFLPPPKSWRLFREIVITEKVDGTHAVIRFDDNGGIVCQSKSRIITPESDNFGFAGWAHRNQDKLFEYLGPGIHRGEWWGNGIQRKYGLTHKRFSLFNAVKFKDTVVADIPEIDDQADLAVVPLLYIGEFDQEMILDLLYELRDYGSLAAPGFDKPEGVMIWHSSVQSFAKITLDNNDKGKWQA